MSDTLSPDPIREGFYTRQELADVLGCSTRTLDRIHKMRGGPPRVRVGHTFLYPKAATADWLARRAEREAARRGKGWAA